jgi:hypothetical protein
MSIGHGYNKTSNISYIIFHAIEGESMKMERWPNTGQKWKQVKDEGTVLIMLDTEGINWCWAQHDHD